MTSPVDYIELAAGCELAAGTDALAGNIMAQLALKGAAQAIREMHSSLTASESLLALTNEALAACQAQAAGKIRELETRLRAARYDDEIDDGDMSDDEQDGHCDCGALHSEGTEESDSGRCSACGGII